MDVQLTLRWRLGTKPSEELPAELIALLDGVARGGNLRFAAREANLSYRHAWGLIKHWERVFAHSLVALERGRGSELTASGELLRQVWHKTGERTAAALAEAAAHAMRMLEAVTGEQDGTALKIAASHSFGVTTLVALLRDAGVDVEVQFLGSEESLKRYAAGECAVAGFHLPEGELGRQLWARFQRYLDARRDVLLLVENRQLGFMARRGSSRLSVKDIATKKLRFLNRQPGSGSRLVFDLLLDAAKIKSAAIDGYHSEEYTHLAVAAVIAGGAADVGFGAQAAAETFGLDFWPEVFEKYFLVVPREAMHRKPISAVQRLLNSQAYKRQLNKVPGSDGRSSGKRLEPKQVPTLIRATPGRRAG
jgi:putative molybdopterin biosynthesis protein